MDKNFEILVDLIEKSKLNGNDQEHIEQYDALMEIYKSYKDKKIVINTNNSNNIRESQNLEIKENNQSNDNNFLHNYLVNESQNNDNNHVNEPQNNNELINTELDIDFQQLMSEVSLGSSSRKHSHKRSHKRSYKGKGSYKGKSRKRSTKNRRKY